MAKQIDIMGFSISLRAFLVHFRGQILKFAIKREQSQTCLSYAEREQIERS